MNNPAEQAAFFQAGGDEAGAAGAWPFACDAECQAALVRYAVAYWVLILPLWLAALALTLTLFLLGLAYRRWPVVVGGGLIGATAGVVTYTLIVAAFSTRDALIQHVGRQASTGFVTV